MVYMISEVSVILFKWAGVIIYIVVVRPQLVM